MENVFDYLKSIDTYSEISKLIDDAEKYRINDPQASIMKVSYILEIIVNKVIESEKLRVSGSDLNTKINCLRGIVLDRTINNMHSIRAIRNSSAAHVSYSTSIIQADKIDSLFCMKKIYEIMQWYLNFNSKKVTDFCAFEEYLESKQPIKAIEANKLEHNDNLESKNIVFPKFYIDYEFLTGDNGNAIDEIEESDIIEVFRMFFTTTHNFKMIEEIVFKNNKPNGNIVYAIIMFYKMIGLTNSWRRFVFELGIDESINLLSTFNEKANDLEKYHRISVLIQLLNTIK